jgi:transposase
MIAALSRTELESLYKKKLDPDVKERLLLVPKVRGDDMIPACVARDLCRSRTWASDWLARYHKEGIDRWIQKQTQEWQTITIISETCY